MRMSDFWNKLKKPFTVLAPMDDVTDNVFRQIINKTARPDVFFTEFTNSDGLISLGGKIVARKLAFTPDQHPIVAQIWGNSPENMGKAAKIVRDLDFDGVDINMSCPVRKVVKKGSGAGLIGNYELSEKIINAVKKGAGELPVSIKTRLGLNVNIAKDWTEFLLKIGISALTIHARTAKQMSLGFADWEEIAKIVEIKNNVSPDTLIIGNGDVKSFQEILEKHKKYKVDGVMIGRGIFGNPWIFDSTTPKFCGAGHTRENYISLFMKHLELFEETRGTDKNFGVMKKFFKMYINNFNGAVKLRVKLMAANSFAEAKKIIEDPLGN